MASRRRWQTEYFAMPELPWGRTARFIVGLEQRADRPWFVPAISLFPLCDYVLPFLPNQMLLLGVAFLRPRRWLVYALAFVAATAFGALLTALAIEYWRTALDAFLESSIEPEQLDAFRVLFEKHGFAGLAALAMLPWPPRTAVIACAVMGLDPLMIAFAVAVGRVLPASTYAFAGARSPKHLIRWFKLDGFLKDLQRSRS